MIKIGITGGVGCGKSKVLKYIEGHTRSRILLADEVAHLVKEPGTGCYRQLVKLLGKRILREDGRICRKMMAELIFQDRELLKRVNEVIHPAVKEYVFQAMRKTEEEGREEVFFLEAALLIEAGYLPCLDELWYIYSEEAVRRERLKESRQYSEEKINQIMAKQLSEEEFRKHAHVIIDNSGNFSDTCKQIEKEGRRLQIWQEML